MEPQANCLMSACLTTNGSSSVTQPCLMVPHNQSSLMLSSPARLSGVQGTCAGGAVAGLTVAAARGAAREGLLYIALANAAVLDFAVNWVDHMVLLDLRNFLVGARLGPSAVPWLGRGVDQMDDRPATIVCRTRPPALRTCTSHHAHLLTSKLMLSHRRPSLSCCSRCAVMCDSVALRH